MTSSPALHLNLTELAQSFIANCLQSGDMAIDATAGNGHDTVFLADCVGAQGQVFSIDIQTTALEATAKHLQALSLADRVCLIQGNHAQIEELIPASTQGRIQAVMFNLGYLPGGDKDRTTQAADSLQALAGVLPFLSLSGCLSVIAYTGHSGGREECESIKAWARSLDSSAYELEILIPGTSQSPPELICIRSIGKSYPEDQLVLPS